MRLNVTFNTSDDIPVNFNGDNDFGLDMGSVIEIQQNDHNKLINRELADQHTIDAITGLRDALNSIPAVLYDTTANWNAHIDYIPPKGAIITYSDYATIDGVDIPNFKISDGLAYLIDQPFVGDDVREAINAHIRDTTVHITAAERAKWNNKVSCSLTQLAENEYMLAFVTG